MCIYYLQSEAHVLFSVFKQGEKLDKQKSLTTWMKTGQKANIAAVICFSYLILHELIIKKQPRVAINFEIVNISTAISEASLP